MQQYDVPEEMKVNIDYKEGDLPPSVVRYQPVVFKDGDGFCCLLGPNPTEGISAAVKTAQETIMDWDAHLQEYIQEGKVNDEITVYIKSKSSEL